MAATSDADTRIRVTITDHNSAFALEGASLRATSAENLLSGRGKIFASPGGDEKTYTLSSVVDTIDDFISHNWVAARAKKFMALSLHYCWREAMLLAYCGAGVGCLLNQLSVPPVLQYPSRIASLSSSGIWCVIIGNMAFYLAVLCSGQVVKCSVLCKTRKAFLDKVCIHQTDPELKKQGIEKLGAFIWRSKSLVVLFSERYCRKLWTVYELACFMCANPEGLVELIVLDFAKYVFILYGCVALALSMVIPLMHIMHVVTPDMGSAIVTLSTLVVIIMFNSISATVFRRWTFRQQKLLTDLKEFTISNTECAVETDRAIVYSRIREFMRFFGEGNGGDELAAFDKLVQEHMPKTLKRCIGFVGISCRDIFLISIPFDFHVFDVISSQSHPSIVFILVWLVYSMWLRCMLAIGLIVVSFLCKTFPKRTGHLAEASTYGVIVTLSTIAMVVYYYIGARWREKAINSNSMVLFAIYLVVTVLCVASVFKLYSYPLGESKKVKESSHGKEQLTDGPIAVDTAHSPKTIDLYL